MKKVIKYILWVAFLLAALTFGSYLLVLEGRPEPQASANFLPGQDEIEVEKPIDPSTPDIEDKPEPGKPNITEPTKNEPKHIPQPTKSTPNGKPSSTGTYYKQWTVQEVAENEEEFVEWSRQSTYSGFETYTQYAQTILGKCPSEREDNSWEDGNPLPALGIIPGTNSDELLDDVEGLWSQHQVPWGNKSDRMARRYGLIYVHSTLTVEYNGNDPYYAQKAAELTTYLRSLDSRYRAKCPNN